MRGPVVGARGRTAGPRDLADADQAAWQSGFDAGQARGLKLGFEAAAEQIAARESLLAKHIANAEKLLEALAAPLRELDDKTERELCQLALAIGKQLARRELAADPSQVIAIVRDTVGLLPANARQVRVHLHPLDAAVVRDRLALPGQDAAWAIVEDPVMGRGGCRVSTENAQIDGRLESRVAALLLELCGEGYAVPGDTAKGI
jgi:flagellar assembly protein FliH